MISLIPAQYRLAAALLGLAIACAACAIVAWTARGWKEDAARLDAERQAHADYIKLASLYGSALNDANDQLETGRQQAAADRRTYERNRKNAKRPDTPPLGICGPGLAATGPAGDRRPVRLTPAFAKLLNESLAIGLPAPLRTNGDHGNGAQPDPGAGN